MQDEVPLQSSLRGQKLVTPWCQSLKEHSRPSQDCYQQLMLGSSSLDNKGCIKPYIGGLCGTL